MNLIEAMRRVDRSDANKASIDFTELSELFNISSLYGYYNEHTLLKAYWLVCVLDTDTDVGERVYELDGEIVAYSRQTGRKSDEEFYFLNEQAYQDTISYLMTLNMDSGIDDVKFLSSDDEIDATFQVEYNNSVEFTEREAYYKGEWVRIDSFIREGYLSNRVVIECNDGEKLTVLISELEFPIRIN